MILIGLLRSCDYHIVRNNFNIPDSEGLFVVIVKSDGVSLPWTTSILGNDEIGFDYAWTFSGWSVYA